MHSKVSGCSSGLNLLFTILVRILVDVGTQLASLLYYLDNDLQRDGPKQIISVDIEQHLSIGRYPTTIYASITHDKL